MLPESIRFLTLSNPFFYFVDGLRTSMVGISEANATVGATLVAVLIITIGWLVMHLFRTGWRIRP